MGIGHCIVYGWHWRITKTRLNLPFLRCNFRERKKRAKTVDVQFPFVYNNSYEEHGADLASVLHKSIFSLSQRA